MYQLSLFTLTLALVPFSSASADSVTHHAEARFNVGEKGAELAVPMPKVSLGLPTSMRVELVVGLRGTVGVENVSKTKEDAVLFVDYGADLSGADGALQVSANGQFALHETLAAYDGAVDFAGESGETLTTQRDTDSGATQLSGDSLKRFIKDTKSRFMTFTARGGASSRVLGLDMSESELRQELVIELVVTYFYDEQPSGSAELVSATPSMSIGHPHLVARPFSSALEVA